MEKDITGDIRVFLNKYTELLDNSEELKKRLDNLSDAILTRSTIPDTNLLGGDPIVQAVSERFIIDAAARYAHQLAFRLFEEGKLTDEINADFRALPTPDQTDKIYREVEQELANEKTVLEIQVRNHQEKERMLGAIQQVLLGQISKEDAVKRFEVSQDPDSKEE